jgi:hypothetical protein
MNMQLIASNCLRALVAQHGRVIIDRDDVADFFGLSVDEVMAVVRVFETTPDFGAREEELAELLTGGSPVSLWWNGYAKSKALSVGSVEMALRELATMLPNAPRAHKVEDATTPFEDFYKPYPRKVAKASARKAWAKMPEPDRQAAVSGVKVYAQVWKSRGADEIRFCPHPASWLNGRRWEDEESEAPSSSMGRGTHC